MVTASSERASPAGSHRPRGILLLASLAAAVLVVIWWRPFGSSGDVSVAELLPQARAALTAREYARAEELAVRIPRAHPSWKEGQLVAGEAALKAGRIEDAIGYYGSVPRDDSRTAVLAAFSLGEACREMGRLIPAEEAYRYVLARQPGDPAVHERMAFLLGVTGRRWESLVHFKALVQSGSWTLDDLVLLGDLERPMEQGDYLRACAGNSPHDVAVTQGLAALALAEGRASEARRLLREVVSQAPDRVAAHVMLGELLVDAEDGAFLDWHAALPADADRYPDTWFVRGLWARRRGDLRVAARCFWETVRLAPMHRRANYQLGQVLLALDEPAGRDFADRASQLVELGQELDDVLRTRGQEERHVRRVAELMEATGRVWEACAWASTAARTFPLASWPERMLARQSRLLDESMPLVRDSANLTIRHDLSGLPSHVPLLAEAERGRSPDARPQTQATIRFEPATEAGIDFVYENGADPSTPGARMFEQTGGGVAVLDYDSDGWPDLFLTQGAEWETGASHPNRSLDLADRIYRNLAGERFEDVTGQAGLGDMGFGQGPAAGDFNNDGFADLYVANIGRNTLYRNNGDGTYSDVTHACGLECEDWTTSCAIVDLNADGWPDLFEVCYVSGERVFDIICNGKACGPQTFTGTPSRLHLSRGDGTFEPVPVEVPRKHAKSLGLIAADLHVRGRPSLFIANDQEPNFLLQNEPADDRFGVRLREVAFASGLAFNEDGLAMGCMGIAADDIDADGHIDFLVTNFSDETNTLYLQDAPGLFVDATNTAGLRAASFPFVGWGTQFLDADRDGEPDVVLTNGHIDDYRDEGGEYHMRPQFFRNTGGGRFVELFADEVGAFFGRKYLGRGLARLDWNRDGRMDFCVSNIGERASLVTNTTAGPGHFLNVRLHARESARDAIGSVVEVFAGGRRWTRQLVGGDGYMATNERVLQFGLGEAPAVAELRVSWPSGSTTTIEDLPVDVSIELVEGLPHGSVFRFRAPASPPVD